MCCVQFVHGRQIGKHLGKQEYVQIRLELNKLEGVSSGLSTEKYSLGPMIDLALINVNMIH
jgi:hypothetical protein